MTRDDIIHMALEAGIGHVTVAAMEFRTGSLTKFAALIAAAEREACAKLLKDFDRFGDTRDCIAAIRARGEKGGA